MPDEIANIRPGYRLLILPCQHCWNCYCYCIVRPEDVDRARARVNNRHRASLALAMLEPGWRDAA